MSTGSSPLKRTNDWTLSIKGHLVLEVPEVCWFHYWSSYCFAVPLLINGGLDVSNLYEKVLTFDSADKIVKCDCWKLVKAVDKQDLQVPMTIFVFLYFKNWNVIALPRFELDMHVGNRDWFNDKRFFFLHRSSYQNSSILVALSSSCGQITCIFRTFSSAFSNWISLSYLRVRIFAVCTGFSIKRLVTCERKQINKQM